MIHYGGVARVEHLPTSEDLSALPTFTEDNPLAILVSACLLGVPCGVDATSYGAPFEHTDQLFRLPNVRTVAFCPEDFSFGTPRRTPDIHGGTGVDVLNGTARVLSDSGEDWTEPMIRAAHVMLAVAERNGVHLAVLTDISAACGSEVIYRGARSNGAHQAGQGVCAALLIRHGIRVISQRDHRTLGRLIHKLDPSFEVDPGAQDHHQSEWYIGRFGS